MSVICQSYNLQQRINQMNELTLASESEGFLVSNRQERMLTRKEAAEFLEVRENTMAIWAITKRYDIPMYKVGKYIKYKLSDLQKFKEGILVSDDTAIKIREKSKTPRKTDDTAPQKKSQKKKITCLQWLSELFKRSN